MTNWALVFTILYSFLSEPGAWRYTQTFGWFKTEAECIKFASDETAIVKKATTSMTVKTVYDCKTLEEIIIEEDY